MRNKVVSVQEAVAVVRDGDTLACSGFGTNGVPEELALALAERFKLTGRPRGLTLYFGGGPGDGRDRGLNCLGIEGMLKRVVGGHFGLVPCVGKLVMEGTIEAYNLPLGVISHMWRDVAQGLPGTVSRVGLDTFVDPRLEGGKLNARTSEPLVEVIRLGGEEMLFYRAPRIQVAFIRGTTADPEGNIVMERETLTQDCLSIATAAKNCGGLVVAQVERIGERGSLNPRRVTVPGILVDCVVVARPEHHFQTFGSAYNPAYSSELRVPLEALVPMPLDERKLIARRAAFELVPNAVVNLGIGMPEGVAAVANEERILKHMTLTAEPGVIGGVPASGLDFGAAVNPDAIIDMNQQFDFYDGGGLDLAVLGLAQCDAEGNINVSRFGPKLAGAGGFINITQNAKKVVFVGTFTAGGLKVRVDAGRLNVSSEGKARKFVKKVEQVTFSAAHARQRGVAVLYVTERCVFRLAPEGLELAEVAPGVDVGRDILARMEFRPIVRKPAPMDGAIFRAPPMGLKDRLLAIGLEERMRFDASRETLFYNFENLRVASRRDIEDIRAAVERLCARIGKKVDLVVNYDGFSIDEDLVGDYAAMVRDVSDRFYRNVTRYTTSAFMRMKLGDALAGRGRRAAHLRIQGGGMSGHMNSRAFERWQETLKVSRRDFVLAPLATGALSLAPRFARAQSGLPFRLGLLLSSTGTGVNYMSHAIRGLPLLAREINQRGGLLGRHPIQLFMRDDATRPEVGARQAAALIEEERVHAILGPYSSAVALAVQEVVHRNKVLHLVATANSSKITEENSTPYTYQFGPDSNMQSGAAVRAVAAYARKNGWKSYVSLGQDYEWGRDTHRGFTGALARAAPEVKELRQIWVKLGETNFTSAISAVRAAKPDFLFGAIAGRDHEHFIQQAHQLALFNSIPYPGGLISVTELKNQRKTLPRGLIGLARCPFFAHLGEPMMQQYIRRDRAAFGPDGYPDDWACMHYDAVNALEQAARKAGSVATEALVKALKGATIETSRGKRAFRDCSNQLDVPSYVGEVWDSRDYPFPIYKPETMIVVEGRDVWTPTCAEVERLKKRRS